MLKDYARYIENIRNSLMQCGVIFPQIDDIDNADYGVLFHIGEKLNDIMYFYKIMVCSGNMEEMFLPLDKSYRGTVRMEAFTEFKEDILPALKEMFGDEGEDDNFSFGVLLDIDGAVESEDEPEVWVNNDVGVEDTLFEADDLFGDDDEDNEDDSSLSFKPVDVAVQFVTSGASLWGTSVKDDTEFVSHGTSLFARKPEPQVQEEINWVSNGTELFSITISSPVDDEDIWIEDSGGDVVADSGDVFTDDEDVWVEDSDEDVFEDASVLEYDDEDVWVDDPEDDSAGDIFTDDDEDVWVEDSEEDSTGDVFTDDDEDVWIPDEEEVIEDVEDVWSDEPEDDMWDEPSGEEPWEDSGASDEISSVPTTVSRPNSPVVSKQPSKPVNVSSEDRDIVDTVQEAASAALTSAKRFLTKLTKPQE